MNSGEAAAGGDLTQGGYGGVSVDGVGNEIGEGLAGELINHVHSRPPDTGMGPGSDHLQARWVPQNGSHMYNVFVYMNKLPLCRAFVHNLRHPLSATACAGQRTDCSCA